MVPKRISTTICQNWLEHETQMNSKKKALKNGRNSLLNLSFIDKVKYKTLRRVRNLVQSDYISKMM